MPPAPSAVGVASARLIRAFHYRHMKPFLLLPGLVLCLLMVTTPAHAYVDPNAGGMLFQLLAPVFAGIVGVWLFLRQWISAFVRRLWRRLTGRNAE